MIRNAGDCTSKTVPNNHLHKLIDSRVPVDSDRR